MKERYLFRGKYAYDASWVYGGYVRLSGDRHVDTRKWAVGEPLHYIMPQDGGHLSIIPETLGQCTELKANGKLVFEGDVIRDGDGKIRVVKWVVAGLRPVALDGKACSWMLYDNGELCAEVIGNVYDNPGLLEGGAE